MFGGKGPANGVLRFLFFAFDGKVRNQNLKGRMGGGEKESVLESSSKEEEETDRPPTGAGPCKDRCGKSDFGVCKTKLKRGKKETRNSTSGCRPSEAEYPWWLNGLGYVVTGLSDSGWRKRTIGGLARERNRRNCNTTPKCNVLGRNF